MKQPVSSEEYARLKALEQKQAAPVRKRTRIPTLADFPPVCISMAEKLSEWVEDANMRKVVMLAYCMYWDKLVAEPEVKRPGAEEYEAYKLLLQLALSPIILPCGKCGWPRAQGYHCHACGDTTKED